jgi:hypothetical protein
MSTAKIEPKITHNVLPFQVEQQVNFPEYLVLPDGCTCSWQAPSIASASPGLILSSAPTYMFAVGRKVHADGRISISRVITDATSADYMKQWYIDAAGNEKKEAALELLVCDSIESTTDNPVVTFANEACGMWSSNGMESSAGSNGFEVGPSRIENVTTYVGRGQWGGEFRAGRYQDDDVSGAYTSSAGDKLMEYSQWLIVPVNCTW